MYQVYRLFRNIKLIVVNVSLGLMHLARGVMYIFSRWLKEAMF
jgi:hypothetical protein